MIVAAHSHAHHGDARLADVLFREIISAGVAEHAAIARVERDGPQFRIATAAVVPRGFSADPVFDLASLSKPLTAVVALAAVADGRLSLATRVGEVLSELAGSAAAGATVEALLSHRAGLPAWGVLYRRDPWSERAPVSLPPDAPFTHDELLARAASRLERPGEHVYSDLGYVLLGAMLRRVHDAPLAELWERVTGITDARRLRARDPAIVERMPPTERVAWRGEVRGEVHDENAAMLERVAGDPGHAGAFATAVEVAELAGRFLNALRGDDALLPRALAVDAIAPRAGGSHTLGWDLRSGDAPSSGARFGPRTFGHLGFTGTSVWIDPDAERAVVLLTNRTWPSRDNVRIRAARPRVHDAAFDD